MRDAMPLMQAEGDDVVTQQMKLLGASVEVAGKQLGADAAGDLGMAAYSKLIKVVMEVNGLADGDEKNG
jgi:hypothetical protein